MAAVISTIDLTPFLSDTGCVVGEPPTEEQCAVAAAIDAACRDHGFVHVVNFGVSRELEAAAFAAASTLFALPDETKSGTLSRITPKTNMGYSPFAFEALNRNRPPDLKEAYNVRSPSVHSNDFAGCPSEFSHVALELWEIIERAARRYAIACGLALGLDSQYFAKALRRMDLCTLRFLHYPPTDAVAAGEGAAAIRVGEHTDFGAFTFLLLGEGAQGLQIKSVAGGQVGGAYGGEVGGWLDVQVPPSSSAGAGAVVNTGAALARWTNDVWCATAHRVIVPSAQVAAAHRYSIAIFIDPDAEAKVEVDARFVPPGEAPKYGPTTGLEFLLSKLREAQGL